MTESCTNYNLHFINDFESLIFLKSEFIYDLSNFKFNIHLNLLFLFIILIVVDFTLLVVVVR